MTQPACRLMPCCGDAERRPSWYEYSLRRQRGSCPHPGGDRWRLVDDGQRDEVCRRCEEYVEVVVDRSPATAGPGSASTNLMTAVANRYAHQCRPCEHHQPRGECDQMPAGRLRRVAADPAFACPLGVFGPIDRASLEATP
ncbi:MAG: hypothetical protein U1A27_00040 [Phycisphaerae bacterium]